LVNRIKVNVVTFDRCIGASASIEELAAWTRTQPLLQMNKYAFSNGEAAGAPQQQPASGPITEEFKRSCGSCGWSWCVGKDGSLLCLNLESPYCYDTVSAGLTCPHHEQYPDQ
jgi:hypothetical protein